MNLAPVSTEQIEAAITTARAYAAVVLTADEAGPEAAACARQVLRAAEVDRRDLKVACDLLAEHGPDVDIRECEIAADVTLEVLAERYGVPRE